MRTWPIVVVKCMVEHFAIEQAVQLDCLLQKSGYVFVEQITGCVVVLVLDDVLDHERHRSNLIGFQRSINCSSVEIFTLGPCLIDFVQVKDREFIRKIVLVFFS